MTLYTDATIITVNASRDIYSSGAILVQGNLIADIGPSEEIKKKYSNEVPVVSLAGRIIIPGLISTHMHTAQSLIRGTLDFLCLKFTKLILLHFRRSRKPRARPLAL